MVQLDAQAARVCEVRAYNAHHRGLTRPGPGPSFSGRDDHLRATISQLGDGVLDLSGLRGAPVFDQQAACLAAMTEGAPLILSGLLPRDEAGGRVGRADLLIRQPGGGYLPASIRASQLLETRKDDSWHPVAPLGDLTAPRPALGTAFRWHHRWRHTLALAHLHRMLQACGFAAAPPAGWLIGTDQLRGLGRVAVRVDLTTPALPPAPGVDPEVARSPLERYDLEFAIRLDLAQRAAASDPTDPPDLVPVARPECARCPWWSSCSARLDADDLSRRITKSPLDVHEITVLRAEGIVTTSDLAHADLEALLPRYLPQVAHRAGAEERVRLAHRRATLLLAGIDLERTSTTPIELPSGHLEIDIDIETSAADRVYLWGFLITDTATGSTSYHPIHDFSDLDDDSETALAIRAMTWLRERIGDAAVPIFHYSDYEVQRILRLAEHADDAVLDWAARLTESAFCDLYLVMRAHFFGTHGLGLKVVATRAAGFDWRDAEPGGLNSLQWFADAVGAASAGQRAAARQRVLEYNEDDVRATAALRQWLRSLG